MDGGPGILAEVTFRSRAECGRWYPPRPPWGRRSAYMALACVEGAAPTLVRFVAGPRLAPGSPGRFVLAPHPPLGDGPALQPGVRFSVLEPRFRVPVGTGRVLERLERTPIPPEDVARIMGELPAGAWYDPPTRLRIARDEHRFTNVGRLADGTQFMAGVVGAFPAGYRYSPDDWQTAKRWQAVAHHFDADGHHLRTDVRLGGVEADDRAGDRAFAHLHAIHDELAAAGEPDFGDIWVRCFSVEIDGIRYELRYERRDDPDEDERYECVTFWPWNILFHPPWDSGEYST